MTELADIIEEIRRLLGWPTNRKLVSLAEKYPSRRAWKYALDKLRGAEYPNQKYLVACLETATHRGRKLRKEVDPDKYIKGKYGHMVKR